MRATTPLAALALLLIGCSTSFAPEAYPYACQSDADCVEGYLCFQSAPETQALCVSTETAICVGGLADCDRDARCETDLRTSSEHCGGCGQACGTDEACETGECVTICAGTRCGGACVDLLTNPTHCGGCGRACASGELCEAGACTCPGQVCGGLCIDVDIDVQHCGACDRACGAGELCDVGACRCETGWADCDGAPGCEASLNALETCGGCGVDCALSKPSRSLASCEEAVCDFEPWPGYADCEQMEGFETRLSDSARHCGVCGNTCDAGCVNGTCLYKGAVRQAAGGSRHMCYLAARGTSGALRCRGSNSFGELGVDPTEVTMSVTALEVPGMVEVMDLDASEQVTCVVQRGEVWCFGGLISPMFGADWQSLYQEPSTPGVFPCGEQQGMFCTQPLRVHDTLSDVERVAVGAGHVCAVRSGGEVGCWGSAGEVELGPDSGEVSGAWSPVVAVPDAVDVVAARKHSCARTATGEVWCWGENDVGQLGTGRESERDGVPRRVVMPGLLEVALDASTYERTTCVIAAKDLDGGLSFLVCWGDNTWGQLGIDPLEQSYSRVPVLVAEYSDVVDVEVGLGHVCALRANGEVYCWGQDDRGQLGNGGGDNSGATGRRMRGADERDPPQRLGGGARTTCGLTNLSNRPVCWGDNAYGQAGKDPAVDGEVLWRGRIVATGL